MDRMRRDTNAVISIDLIFALILIIAVISMVLLILPALSQKENDWRLKQYMAAVRATDDMVLDGGSPAWEQEWASGNYFKVTRIGLTYSQGNQKILGMEKIQALMQRHEANGISWWEFPDSTTSEAARENASRALGLSGYNFYMQLHPVGINSTEFDSAPLEQNLSNRVINYGYASQVDRYVYIKDYSGKYLTYDNLVLHYRLNLWVW